MTISDKDLKNAGQKSKKQSGRRFPVGDERLTLAQISELTGKSKGYCHTALNLTTAEKFIKRVGLKGEG